MPVQKMKKIIIMAVLVAAFSLSIGSCRMAPSQDNGDTVAASVFEPIDTSVVRKHKKAVQVRDSSDIYIIGEGSERKTLQLVSYPTRKDTIYMKKARHIIVEGSADYGHVMRVTLGQDRKGDTIVVALTEIVTPNTGD